MLNKVTEIKSRSYVLQRMRSRNRERVEFVNLRNKEAKEKLVTESKDGEQG